MVRGSIHGQPGDLAVEAQLIDLDDGTIVAAERVRGDDVFALSDSVALLLSGRVVAAAGPPPAKGGLAFADRRPDEATRPSFALVGDIDKLKEFQVDLRKTWDSLSVDSIGARYRMVELLEQVPGREDEIRQALDDPATVMTHLEPIEDHEAAQRFALIKTPRKNRSRYPEACVTPCPDEEAARIEAFVN